jgi:hypothetical protein
VNVEDYWRDTDKKSTWKKTCAIAYLATTNPTWNGLGLNSGLDNYGSATDCLNYVKPFCVGHSGTWTGFSLSTSVFLVSYCTASVPHSLMI